jgi:hypothetical protein
VDEGGGDPGWRRRRERACRWGVGRRDRPAGRGGWGEAGEGPAPGDDALAGEHAEAERERLAAPVQGGMAKLLVAGIETATGNAPLADIRTVRFCSRSAR